MPENLAIAGPALPRPATKPRRWTSGGRAQLSLVEHALCPLDPSASLREHLVHETAYGFTDRNGHLKRARVRVLCPSGLSAADEFMLWGLLALTFAQSEPGIEFHATPHYCLRQLGIIGRRDSKGGKQYQLFRETVRRLSRVVYENTAFYDPIRGEHRDVAFGFLKYSLPLDPNSSRAWRLVWDQQFFEFCQATGGGLWFDLATYRRLDLASRRLFVLLQKVFHRSSTSPTFDVRKLCVDVLGFAPTIATRNLKIKLHRSLDRLSAEGIVLLPAESSGPLFRKQAAGQYSLTLRRGPYFDVGPTAPAPLSADESPLVDPLRAIGLDDGAIRRVLKEFRPALIGKWADITLAARERHGAAFFTKSAAAYLLDNLRHAAAGNRTPPDWWLELRRQEDRRRRAAEAEESDQRTGEDFEAAFSRYLEGEARAAYLQVTNQVVGDLRTAGKSTVEARETGQRLAQLHFRNRFRREHPEFGKPSAN